MFKILQTRFHQGYRTIKYPLETPVLPERYRGRLQLDPAKCQSSCNQCVPVCPTQAITKNGSLSLDLGKCVFCTDCVEACSSGALEYTRDHRMAVDKRADLVLTGQELKLAHGMGDEIVQILGRALRLREVCAGSCNACDLDINVLNTVGWDLSRFGIQFVASPRHADGLVVTGSIPRNMHYALKDCYAATPDPKIVVAIGACAISGGVFANTPAEGNGIGDLLPVDLYIPGCPPHPLTILDGFLRLIHRIRDAQP